MPFLLPYEGNLPIVGKNVFLAETATVIGNATLLDDASVWFGAVIRADELAILVGARTNIQDNAVLHVTSEQPVRLEPDSRGKPVGCQLGDDVTVGHGAIIHACSIGSRVLVGMGAIILDGAVIEDDVAIAAGCLVPPRMRVLSGSLVMGNPAKVVRTLTEKDRFWSTHAASMYVGYATRYRT